MTPSGWRPAASRSTAVTAGALGVTQAANRPRDRSTRRGGVLDADASAGTRQQPDGKGALLLRVGVQIVDGQVERGAGQLRHRCQALREEGGQVAHLGFARGRQLHSGDGRRRIALYLRREPQAGIALLHAAQVKGHQRRLFGIQQVHDTAGQMREPLRHLHLQAGSLGAHEFALGRPAAGRAGQQHASPHSDLRRPPRRLGHGQGLLRRGQGGRQRLVRARIGLGIQPGAQGLGLPTRAIFRSPQRYQFVRLHLASSRPRRAAHVPHHLTEPRPPPRRLHCVWRPPSGRAWSQSSHEMA
jgi:hypothetical protein